MNKTPLKTLWSEYKRMAPSDPRIPKYRQEINDREEWMIEKGYKTDPITKWDTKPYLPDDYPENTGYIYLNPA